MGFLFASKSLSWDESLAYLRYIRDHGIEQFLHTFHAVRSVHEDLLRWGDEIEYGVIHLDGSPDDPNRRVQASLRSAEMIADLKRIDDHGQVHGLSESDRFAWMPEYGAWMLESTPGKPYEGISSLLEVENNMMMRRSRLLAVLNNSEIVPTMSCFPMLGVGESTYPSLPPGGPVTNSIFVPDGVIFPHPRFPTLTQNIRMRRGEKVKINRPKFIDSKTLISGDSNMLPTTIEEADNLPYVYADAMAFGMGCCSLQTTFQAKDLAESRHLYDHLATLTPVMLALSAATPMLRGWLTDTDCRWDIVSQSVDDRTRAERGDVLVSTNDTQMAGNGTRKLAKSRFGPIDCYLCNCKNGKFEQSRASLYNDIPLVYDEDHYKRLVSSGVDHVLAEHVAHLFARDPLVVFPDRVDLDDRADSDHWESLQSTNWQTVRWKPPPSHKGIMDTKNENHIGWRVEFRSMEIQITDFENAAFVIFVVLLSRVILGLELNMYIPISKLDENMERAQKRDAVLNEKFWFRSNLFPADIKTAATCGNDKDGDNSMIEEMTVSEILIGKGDHYPGLIPLCRTYLDFIGCDSVTHDKVDRYLNLLSERASGKLLTNAAWIRQFIRNHPDYAHDSRIPHSTAYDLLVACKEIGEGIRQEPGLVGSVIPRIKPGINPFSSTPHDLDDANDLIRSAAQKACKASSTKCRKILLQTYIKRAIEKREKMANEELCKKMEELERLKSDINRIVGDLDLMRSSSERIAVESSQDGSKLTTPPQEDPLAP